MIFEQRIEIYHHRRQWIFLILGCIFLLAVGTWLLIDDSFALEIFGLIPVNNKITGSFLVLMGGLCLYVGIKRLSRKLPALVLDEKGMLDATAFDNGLDISWEEISDVHLTKLSRYVIIVVALKDPEGFIQRQESKSRRRSMKVNLRMVGSPVAINATMLDYGNQELFRLMKERVGR